MIKGKRVVLGVTGSIAAYKAADIIRRLIDAGIKVSVVMTKEAEDFITPLTLASVSGEKVYRSSIKDEESSWQMPHIRLAKEADLLLIAPATANIIGKIANGIADDLLTTIVLATNSPILFVPAMNTEMYNNKIVKENCSKLTKYGMTIMAPKEGKLACGDYGQGHIPEVDQIIQEVTDLLK